MQDRKTQAFKLFEAGKTDSSSEIKSLGLKAGTRRNYYREWLAKKGKKGEPHAVKEGLIVGMLPEPQGIKLIEPLPELEPDSDEDLEEETLEENTKEIGAEPPTKPPKRRLEPAFGEAEKETFTGDLVTGDTLPFKVEVSIKTLALYQMAATEAANNGDGELSLGRFLDTCVEDYYIGRGYDLGLLELKGGEHA